jgi:hypothetical protein
MRYVDTYEDFFWSLDVHAVGFSKSGQSFKDATLKKFKEPVYSIIDTSSPSISLTSSYFDQYIDALFSKTKGKDYEIVLGQVTTKCDYEFPNLYFMIGDYWVEIRPDEYVIDVSESKNATICLLTIEKNSEDFNIIGNPLLMNYYTTFDMESGQIGFAPYT